MPRNAAFNKLLPAFALALLLFTFITMERGVQTDGAYDKLYGFPFGWTPNAYYSSMVFDVFLIELVVDLLIYTVAASLLLRAVAGTPRSGTSYGMVLRVCSSIAIGVLLIFQCLTHIGGQVRLFNDCEYKLLKARLFVGSHP